jgi:hypothetical protein
MTVKQQILSALFLSLYALAILRPYTPYVNYYLNKEQIAEEKCINKDKPKLECDGKCYLKSQVIGMQKEDDSSPVVVDLEVEKYIHDGVIYYDVEILSQSRDKKKMMSIGGFNVLHRCFSVPEPLPQFQSEYVLMVSCSC